VDELRSGHRGARKPGFFGATNVGVLQHSPLSSTPLGFTPLSDVLLQTILKMAEKMI
jgi:hypothetical protein